MVSHGAKFSQISTTAYEPHEAGLIKFAAIPATKLNDNDSDTDEGTVTTDDEPMAADNTTYMYMYIVILGFLLRTVIIIMRVQNLALFQFADLH